MMKIRYHAYAFARFNRRILVSGKQPTCAWKECGRTDRRGRIGDIPIYGRGISYLLALPESLLHSLRKAISSLGLGLLSSLQSQVLLEERNEKQLEAG